MLQFNGCHVRVYINSMVCCDFQTLTASKNGEESEEGR